MYKTWVQSLGQEDPLEKEMATHSSVLAWEISRTEEAGGLQSVGSQESEMTYFYYKAGNKLFFCYYYHHHFVILLRAKLILPKALNICDFWAIVKSFCPEVWLRIKTRAIDKNIPGKLESKMASLYLLPLAYPFCQYSWPQMPLSATQEEV